LNADGGEGLPRGGAQSGVLAFALAALYVDDLGLGLGLVLPGIVGRVWEGVV